MFARVGEIIPPLRGACPSLEPFAVLHVAGVQPFLEYRLIHGNVGDEPVFADFVEAAGYVCVQNPFRRASSGLQHQKALTDRVSGGSVGPEAIRVWVRCGFRDRQKRKQVKSLHGPVDHGGNPQWTQFSVCLGYEYPSQRLRAIAPPSERQDSSDFRARRVPDDPVHAGRPLSLVLGNPFHGKCLAAERGGQQPLKGFHPAPAAFLDCLRDTHLQPPHGLSHLVPVDLVPVRFPVGGRTSHCIDRHLPVLLMMVLPVFSR